MSNVSPVTFTLPRGLVDKLDEVAAADDRSRSAVVRRVLTAALAADADLREAAAERFAVLQGSARAAPPAADSPPADARPLFAEAARARRGAPIAQHEVPPMPDLNSSALDRARAADADARQRAGSSPAMRPAGGPLDVPAGAPGQTAAAAERKRLADFYSRPAPEAA